MRVKGSARPSPRTLDTVLAKVVLSVLVEVRGMQESLRGDATDIEARSTKRGTLLDAGGLETQLTSLDGRNVTARTRTNYHNILLLYEKSEAILKGTAAYQWRRSDGGGKPP